MGVDEFILTLDNPSRQYSSGDNVSGKVFLRISDVETTTELTVRFFGSVNTYWREFSMGGFGYKSGHYTFEGQEAPFDFAVRLLGDGNNRIRIPPGDNVFPFVFQVPVRPLPVTCSFEQGKVWYGMEGCIKKPWYSSDTRTLVVPVTLYSKVDLNLSPAAGNPIQVADTHYIGCCCCSQKPCTLRSYTPRMGFCVGEMVPLVVEVDNQSSEPLCPISATLNQVWSLTGRPCGLNFRGDDHKTIAIPLVTVARSEDVGPNQVTRWEVPLNIPPTVAPTSVPGASELIQLGYSINIFAGTKSGSEHFDITHPIIVGTIPLISPSVVSVQIPKYNEGGGLA